MIYPLFVLHTIEFLSNCGAYSEVVLGFNEE